ncbi:MAG: hypothetical protein P8K68_12630 [Algibacter sp.]|uniref:hypothetical protein n=1 Tax=Algibacter sp. TaxID=1872428 RepID=UPI0026344576|nr:hypothetical protein [Algibacter sp.]MDG1728625.1 hypothetical protein [Algibacter sp.]MDG2179610.1 hypothetical protein [Algibacter sp.]
MKRLTLRKFVYLLLALLVFNCSSDSSDDVQEQEEENQNSAVTYNNTVRAIISNNCTNCHGNPTANGAPTSYTTYTQVRNGIDNIISRINNASNPMPQNGLMTQSLRDDIQQWKDDGLLEN